MKENQTPGIRLVSMQHTSGICLLVLIKVAKADWEYIAPFIQSTQMFRIHFSVYRRHFRVYYHVEKDQKAFFLNRNPELQDFQAIYSPETVPLTLFRMRCYSCGIFGKTYSLLLRGQFRFPLFKKMRKRGKELASGIFSRIFSSVSNIFAIIDFCENVKRKFLFHPNYTVIRGSP